MKNKCVFLTFLIEEAATLAITMEIKTVNIASNKQSRCHALQALWLDLFTFLCIYYTCSIISY